MPYTPPTIISPSRSVRYENGFSQSGGGRVALPVLDSGTLPADRSTPCIPRQPEHFLLTTIPLATNTTQEPKKDAKPQGRNESEFTRIVSKRYADVYKIDKHYIGLLRELPPPSEVQNKWDQDIRPELENHLCQATRLLSKSMRDEEVITEPVLCMAGKKCSPSSVTMEPGVVCPKDPIALNPTLWIYCGSKKCKKKVSEAIRTLAYLRHFVERFNMDAPYTSLHAPWPAAKDNALFSDNTLGNYNSVSFSIQQSKLRTEVGCGVKAKFTIQASFGSIERHSIIGGYIMVDSSLFGLTSAHGIVNCLRDLSHNSSSASDESKNLSNESSEIDSDYVSSSGSESDASEDIKPFLATSNADAKRYPLPADKGYTALEDEWMTTSTPGIIAYMGHGTSAGDLSLPHAAPSTADFALVDVQSIGAPSNEYHDQSQGSSSVITDYLPTAQITSGDVWIIYSHSAPALKGYLLEGNASIILRGTVIRTKKIQLKSPGSPGLSGSWVVRREKLYGVIYAAYDRSPYLHMLPSESMFEQITEFLLVSIIRIATPSDFAQYLAQARLSPPAQEIAPSRRGPDTGAEGSANRQGEEEVKLEIAPLNLTLQSVTQQTDDIDVGLKGGNGNYVAGYGHISLSQAVYIAQNSEGGVDQRLAQYLERKLSEVWVKLQAQPSTYVFSSDEFALINYYKSRFGDSEVVRNATKRYWDCHQARA